MADFIHPNNNLFDKFHPASSPNYLSKTMNHETHYCCNKRLKEEGSKARCCECCPHETCEDSPSRFKPEHIQAAIRGSNADQKAMMEKAKLTNKTNKLIELIQTIYTQKGNADSRGNLGVMLNDLVTTAREEERAEWKEKVKEATRLRMACACLKPNCEKDGWNSAMESVERSLLSNKEGYET